MLSRTHLKWNFSCELGWLYKSKPELHINNYCSKQWIFNPGKHSLCIWILLLRYKLIKVSFMHILASQKPKLVPIKSSHNMYRCFSLVIPKWDFLIVHACMSVNMCALLLACTQEGGYKANIGSFLNHSPPHSLKQDSCWTWSLLIGWTGWPISSKGPLTASLALSALCSASSLSSGGSHSGLRAWVTSTSLTEPSPQKHLPDLLSLWMSSKGESIRTSFGGDDKLSSQIVPNRYQDCFPLSKKKAGSFDKCQPIKC